MARLRGVVAKAIVIIVDLIDALLQDRDDVVKRAEAIRIVLTAGVCAVDRDDGIIPILACQCLFSIQCQQLGWDTHTMKRICFVGW